MLKKLLHQLCKERPEKLRHATWTFQQVTDYGRFHHRLPYEFNFWAMTNLPPRSGLHRLVDLAGKRTATFTTISHEAARKGWLPENFDQWHLIDSEGLTVAHALVEGIAAGHSSLPARLPEDFWSMRGEAAGDFFPLPVAHHAVEAGYPCEAFTSEIWAIRDAAGQTAAHRAALLGRLPDNFQDWGLRDAKMNTVAHVTALQGSLPERFDAWTFVDEEGAHWPGWMMRNDYGDTVAHLAAKKGLLPVSFGRHALWNMADQRNQSVIEVARRRGHVHLMEQHQRDLEARAATI